MRTLTLDFKDQEANAVQWEERKGPTGPLLFLTVISFFSPGKVFYPS